MTEERLLSALRERRVAVGLSQQSLAERVGASRQALIAIEAGRQVPSTDLALRLAGALGCAVEDLFRLPAHRPIQARLTPPTSTSREPVRRVRLGRVNGAWIAHPLCDDFSVSDGLIHPAPAAGALNVVPLEDPALLRNNVLVAGCAPLLGLLAGRMERRFGDARATWIGANSTRALQLLAEGRVHVAGLHLVEAARADGHAEIVRARFPGESMTVVSLTRWRQGLVTAPGNPLGIEGVADLARLDVRSVLREEGSGAQKLLRRALRREGIDDGMIAEGLRAAGHQEVARLVRWGVGDVGVSIEAAAVAEGLTFLPLSNERFDLVVHTEVAGSAPVDRLFDMVSSGPFRAEAGTLPGYDLETTGDAVTVAG